MPTTVTVLGCNYDVREQKGIDPESQQEQVLRVLILEDPATGVAHQYIFPAKNAEDIGKMLQGEKPADLVVASPGDIPAHPGDGKPPGPAQPSPTAGRGRPHR